jgi:hypothetical protein
MFESISFKGVDLLISKFLVISLINTLNNVLYKLCKMGVGLHFLKLLKEQYLNTTSSLKHKDQHSVFFNISRGVKQGDSSNKIYIVQCIYSY